MKATPEDVAKSITSFAGAHSIAAASMKATPEDVAKHATLITSLGLTTEPQ